MNAQLQPLPTTAHSAAPPASHRQVAFVQSTRHLKVLDPEAESWCFQTFDDNADRKDPKLARVLNGTLAEHYETLKSLQKRGAGIFVVVNLTDGKGRKLENITGIRAVWKEDDNKGVTRQLPIEPHITIKTSIGENYHHYILVEDAPLDEFDGVQSCLVNDYGSDPAAADKARVLRLAGFFHQKVNKKKGLTGKKFRVEIIHESGALPLKWEKVKEIFPPHEVKSRTKPKHGDPGTNPVLAALMEKNLYIGTAKKEGAHDIICPWADDHSGDNKAAYFEPNHGGYAHHGFKCQHGHSQAKNPADRRERTVAELLKHLGVRKDAEAAPIEWETPEPIETRLKPVPPLPESLIPEPFRVWIMDVAHRMQTPPDFTAVTAMTVTASIIGTACAIRPKQRCSWEVVPNLWGACIGRPSVVLKSPSMKEAVDLLVRLQGEAGEVFAEDQLAYEFDRKVAEIKSKNADKAILKAVSSKDSQAVDACRDDFVNAADIAEPVRRLYKTNETSIQSQTVLQAQNPRGLLTFRDEITGLLSRWDTKEHEDERYYFLDGWNGNNSYTDFKIGRGLTDAPQICISLIGGIQPDKLRRYLYQSMNGNNDGLVQRLQLAVYPDEPVNWTLIDQYPDTAEKTRVFEIMRKLADLDFAQVGAEQGEYDKFPFLRFTSDGQEVFDAWTTELEIEKLRNEDESPLILEHLGKYRSLMPTLALVIHLIGVVDGTAEGAVSRQAAIQAAAWCDYLEGHARRIYACVMSPAQEAAAILAERIHRLPDPFTVKDVYRKGWTLLKTRQEAEAACRILEDADWLKMERLESETGRPPLPRYWINPALVERK